MRKIKTQNPVIAFAGFGLDCVEHASIDPLIAASP
jgi:hypothetical protein